jgi:hypothetical protein
MTELPDKSDRTAQMNGIYQALGRFFVEFSRIVSMMESNLIFLCGGDQQIVRAIVIELTAQPMLQAWRSAITQAMDLPDQESRILKELIFEVSTMITLRNNWSHGSWFVGFADESMDFSKAGLWRFKNTATGVAPPNGLDTEPTAEHIEKAATHAALVADAIGVFGTIVTMRRQGLIKETLPSDRIRITKADGHREFHFSRDGEEWQSSRWG